jgi:hypothetical protein
MISVNSKEIPRAGKPARHWINSCSVHYQEKLEEENEIQLL